MNQSYEKGLLEELRGYEQRGLKARAAAVRAELKRIGAKVPSAGKVETTAAKPAETRRKPTKKESSK